MPVESAYVHIPFRSYKCHFCDFVAFQGLEHLSSKYCSTVCLEIEKRLKTTSNSCPLGSVFYGGGTPGLIDPALIGQIHHKLVLSLGMAGDAEITMETTPQSITYEKACAWLELGINRLSVGVQTFNDDELSNIGRNHTAQQALEGLNVARAAGFTNIGIDLMYGLPTQTKVSFLETLKQALDLGFPHLSAYGLTIADNTPLLIRYPRASASYPSESDYVFMYEKLTEMAKAYGLERYEISNFAKPGFESKHNLSCWEGGEYFAFGVGAHRFVDSVRSANWRSFARYMKEWYLEETKEVIDQETKIKEAVLLGLRKAKGINFAEFKDKYGVDLQKVHAGTIAKLTDGGFLEADPQFLRLTVKGVLVSNLVISELI